MFSLQAKAERKPRHTLTFFRNLDLPSVAARTLPIDSLTSSTPLREVKLKHAAYPRGQC